MPVLRSPKVNASRVTVASPGETFSSDGPPDTLEERNGPLEGYAAREMLATVDRRKGAGAPHLQGRAGAGANGARIR